MSDDSIGQGAGPALAHSIHEVQGRFPNNATLQDALGRLTIAGYDRADFSLPDEQAATMPMPNETAENPTDEIDKAQLRTMGTSMAGFAGAATAGGVVLATGGLAAVAAAAAAAVGLGAGAVAGATGLAVDRNQEAEHDRRGAEGRLILAVRARNEEKATEITALMQQAGGTDVRTVDRGEEMLTAGVSSASWTGA